MINKNYAQYENIIQLKISKNKKYSDEYLSYMFDDLVNTGLFTHAEFKEFFEVLK